MTENHHHHHHHQQQQQQQQQRRRRRDDDNDDVHQFTEIYTRHISLPARCCMPPMKIITQYPRFVRLPENNFPPLRYSLLFYSPT